MRKVILLIVALSVVAVASVLIFRKTEPATPTKAVPKKPNLPQERAPQRDSFPYRPSEDSSRSHSHDGNDDDARKRQFADSFFQNSDLDDEFALERDALYRELDALDEYSDPWQHAEYQHLYDQYAQDELEREYEDAMMYDYALWEMERLNEIYADADVKNYRAAELSAKKEEKKGKKWDKKEVDNLPKERKDLVKDLADLSAPSSSKKDKAERANTLGRVHEATKDQSTEQMRKVRDKLSDKVALKEKAGREKFKKDRSEKIKSLAAEIKNETTLFSATKDEMKFYIFGVQPQLSLEESLPAGLEKKILNSDVLITSSKEFEIKRLFDDQDKTVIVMQEKELGSSHMLDGIEPAPNQKVLVAVALDGLVSDRGLLQALISEGFSIKRYNLEGKSVKYTPLRRKR